MDGIEKMCAIIVVSVVLGITGTLMYRDYQKTEALMAGIHPMYVECLYSATAMVKTCHELKANHTDKNERTNHRN
jgi:hypothetical protein